MKVDFNVPWIVGLVGVSGVGGLIGSFLIFLGLLGATKMRFRDVVDREWFYSGFLTGIFERFFFTLTIGMLSPDKNAVSIVSAMIGWIAIKGQAHYRLFSEPNNKDIPRIYLGLLGSLGSLLFSVAGGFTWLNGWKWNDLASSLGWT
jgi:hypothetical protein